MSDELLFTLLNASILPGWVMLLIAPRWGWTARLVHSGFYSALLALVYGFLLFGALFLGQGASEGNFNSLAGVQALFSHPRGVLVGWTHYLAFDLFIGAWVCRDAIDRSMPIWLRIPILIFCLLVGPIGFLIHFLIGGAYPRSGDDSDDQAALA